MRFSLYVEAPTEWDASPDDGDAIFFGGGITGCPDWQWEMVGLLRGHGLTILNPRRYTFDTYEGVAEEQIDWEFRHLRMADKIIFWFPKETLCPITLFELGAWSASDTPIAVGVEPGYQRELDVREQMRLVRPGLEVVDSLPALAEAILATPSTRRTA